MLNITATQTLFSGIAIPLVIAGFICVLIPRRTKFGILTVLLSNIPLVIAVAFPKPMAEFMKSNGYDSIYSSDNLIYFGAAIGCVFFALWYFIRSKFVLVLYTKKNAAKATESSSKTDEKASNTKTTQEKASVATKTEDTNPVKEEKAETTKAKIEPIIESDKLANPHLFDNLKLDNLRK